jgi:shikimate dehydrogenase
MAVPPPAGRGTRLGVLGWPVAHSLSPAMHNAALAAAGLTDWHYQLLPAPPERLAEILAGLPAVGFVGANVTVPHKAAALGLAHTASERAAAIGAANTLTFADGAIAADNTDAPALIEALPGPVAGRRAVVVGAGGTARAAVWALREAGAGVVVVNRTLERAKQLADRFGARAADLADGVPPGDLLVHTTTLGLHGEPVLDRLGLDAAALGRFACVVDFIYAPGGGELVRAATAARTATVDGLSLLLGQGALAFEIFTGRRAPREAMRAALMAGSPA